MSLSGMGTYVIGAGQVTVGEHWKCSLRDLAADAAVRALGDAGLSDASKVGAVVVANMASSGLSGQENLGALVADAAGLVGTEAVKVEAACASGGAALHVGRMLIASGTHEFVLVVGVEKMTDALPETVNSHLAMAADADAEAVHGFTFAALNALLTRLYMERYGYESEDFAAFSLNAHLNACDNPAAMFRKQITLAAYLHAPLIASPLRTLDSPPICDGAAALVLARGSAVKGRPSVCFAASAGATDTIAVAERKDALWLAAASRSAERALRSAGLKLEAVDLFELHDAFPIMAALSLEACGFVERGQAVRFASSGGVARDGGKLPIQTMGGLKARGHPVGATGIYQGVEAYLQLCGRAGACQVPGARVALTQNIGGTGAVAFTSVFTAQS